MEPLLRGYPVERPPSLCGHLTSHNVKLHINALISTPDERPPFLRGHFSDAKGVASQEGFHCICILFFVMRLEDSSHPIYRGP